MNILKKLLYKPYLLFFIFLTGWIYYYALNKPISALLNSLFVYSIYIFFFRKIFPLLQHSLLKLVNQFSFFDKIPNHVISGYCFIFTLLFPVVTIPLALISKLFIKENLYQNSFVDDYGNEVTQIKSLTPTVFFSRRNGEEEEHIVVTKLKKKPKKITYE